MTDPRIVSRRDGAPLTAGTDGADGSAAYDPLQLCVFATVALLGWLLGPIALIGFAGLGFLGYAKARRAGLTRSRCLLRDTRLVLAYLAVLVVVGVAGAVLFV